MGKVMTATDFVNKAKDIANNYKTLYVMGCFGSPLNEKNKVRYSNNYAYNKRPERTAMIKNASADTFGFDCICLVKGILWGWNGNVNDTYGGAKYASNGVPDVDTEEMMKYCYDVSSNFSNIQVGELLHLKGHTGIYIGDGLAVECSPIWKNKVQITAVGNIGAKSGYNTRTWTEHGKSNFIDYNVAPTPSSKKSIDEIAQDVIAGKYGNYPERKTKLEAEGYNYAEVQARVNELVAPKPQPVEGFKVGDYVVPTVLVDYKGTHLRQYDEKYQIIGKDNRGNILGAVRGTQRPIWAVLPDSNIKKVG